MSYIKRQSTVGEKIFDVCNYTFMILLMIIMIYPMMNVIAISLSTKDYVIQGLVTWLPKGFNTESYQLLVQDITLWRSYLNTIAYAGSNVIINIILTAMVSYTLSIKQFVGRKYITIFIAITMFFSGGMIPTYINIKNLHLIDTFWVMVIPGSVSAFNVIVFRTFFEGIGSELRESAIVDGANDLLILRKIYLPLSKALIATFSLFIIVGTWNSWFSALIYLNDEMKHPLQLYLRKVLFVVNGAGASEDEMLNEMLGEMNPRTIQMATVVIVMFPIVVLYPFLQKHFAKGVMVGSIKG